jgi:hypothetical protein
VASNSNFALGLPLTLANKNGLSICA